MSAASDLLARVGGHRRWIAASTVLGLITGGSGIALIGTATYLLTRSAFDTGVSLSLAILAVRASAVVRVVARYVDRYVGHLGTFRVLTELRTRAFEWIASADPRLVLRRDRGDVVTGLVEDIETMQDQVLRVAAPRRIAGGVLLIAMIAMAIIDPTAAIVSTAILASISIASSVAISARTTADQAAAIDLRSRRMAALTEGFDARDELMVWGRTDLVIDETDRLADTDARLRHRMASTDGTIAAVLTGAVAMAVVASVMILDRQPPTGGHRWWIAAVPLMVIAASEVLAPMIASVAFASRTDAAAGRLLDLANDPTADARVGSAAATLPSFAGDGLELTNVSFRHPDGPHVLVHADLSVPTGSRVWISAPSGVGKSSVVALLAGLIAPDDGRILLDGTDVDAVPRTPTSPIATALQHDHLFDTSIRDDLLVADGDADDARLREVCELVGLTEFLDRREGGFDAPAGPDGASLSGGERQRLIVARSLTAQPAMLLLDEPIEHLDRRQGESILVSILSDRSDRITIVFTHDRPPLTIAPLIDAEYRLTDGGFIAIDR